MYSAKDLEELNAKNIEYPDGSRSQVYGFGKSTSQKSTGVAKKYYRTWSKEHNINNIETLAEYYNVKYNDIKMYQIYDNLLCQKRNNSQSAYLSCISFCC